MYTIILFNPNCTQLVKHKRSTSISVCMYVLYTVIYLSTRGTVPLSVRDLPQDWVLTEGVALFITPITKQHLERVRVLKRG